MSPRPNLFNVTHQHSDFSLLWGWVALVPALTRPLQTVFSGKKNFCVHLSCSTFRSSQWKNWYHPGQRHIWGTLTSAWSNTKTYRDQTAATNQSLCCNLLFFFLIIFILVRLLPSWAISVANSECCIEFMFEWLQNPLKIRQRMFLMTVRILHDWTLHTYNEGLKWWKTK